MGDWKGGKGGGKDGGVGVGKGDLDLFGKEKDKGKKTGQILKGKGAKGGGKVFKGMDGKMYG